MKEKSNNFKDKFLTENKLQDAIKAFSLQNGEKEKRVAELIIANRELALQNEQKEKRASELIIANRELAFQNEEKDKRAEELLFANKELASLNTEQRTLFASIVNSSDDAMLSKTIDGTITSWNPGAENIFGYRPDEIIGKHIFILIPPHLQNEEAEIIKKIRNGERVEHYETERVKKNGTIFNASLTISPIRDLKGNITGASKILRDITERKKTEEQMKLLAKRLQLATNSAGMGIWDWDTVNDHLVWDQGMYHLYNINEKQFEPVHDGLTSRMHPQDLESGHEDIQNAITGRKEYDTDFRIVLDDSSVRYIKATGIVERDADGNALRMIGANWDITELKEKENRLRKSEVFNRTVLNSLSAHLAVANDKGEIISINEAWTSFALRNGESSMERTGIGSNYFEVCEKASIAGDVTAAQALQGMKDVLNKKTNDFYLEYPCHSPSEQRWFGLSITKFEGDEPLILLVHTDLTERILAEVEREKIMDDLIHRNRDQEQFTYIVSHNLRAPLANIKGLSDMLADESLSKDKRGNVVEHLLSSVRSLDNVVLDLNDILQLKMGVSGAKERVVLAELLHEIEASIHSLISREKVEIVAQFDEVAEMICIKSYLHSIFYNLIGNSIKYKRRDVHPVIEIKSVQKGNTVELIFKDNGRGIDLKNSGGQVFGLYKRFHHDVEGKGMGLFMVKTQVEGLGGEISIESEVDKGTEFKIIFPKEKTNGN